MLISLTLLNTTNTTHLRQTGRAQAELDVVVTAVSVVLVIGCCFCCCYYVAVNKFRR